MDMTNQNGYLVPKMAMKETHRPPVGRIGLQREKFLQENHSLLYDKMLLDGTALPRTAARNHPPITAPRKLAAAHQG